MSTCFIRGTGFNSFPRDLGILPDNKIIAVGDFTQFQGNTVKDIVRINTDGYYDSTFQTGTGTNIYVEGVLPLSDGKIIILGPFNTYSGITSNRIARLNTDGSYDSTFTVGTGFNFTPNVAQVQSDGKIIVGGGFSTYRSNSSRKIVRINTDGSYDSTFNVGVGFDQNSMLLDLKIQNDGKVLAVGNFTSYQGTSRNGIVRLNTDGSYDSSFNIGGGFNSYASTLATQTDGKILIGGDFTEYQGVPRNYIVRLNTDGSIDTTFITGSGFDSSVHGIEIQSDGKIVVIGFFQFYSGISSNYIVRLNSDGSYDSSFDMGLGFDSWANHILSQLDGKLVIGGAFDIYNNNRFNNIARLNIDGSPDICDSIPFIDPIALNIVFDEILMIESLLPDPYDVTEWNNFFDLPAYGNPFSAVTVTGTTVQLYGGSSIIIKDSLFNNNDSIISIIDDTSVLGVGDSSFRDCISLEVVEFPLAQFVSYGAFEGSSNLSVINLPSIVNLGNSTTYDEVFRNIAGNVDITLPESLLTINNGAPDGDLIYLSIYSDVVVNSNPFIPFTGYSGDLTFSVLDISNTPVSNPNDVNEWNIFFDHPSWSTPFSAVTTGETFVTLIGGENIVLKENKFNDNNLLEIVDGGCICFIEWYGIYSDNITTIDLPALKVVSEGSFGYNPVLSNVNLPSLVVGGAYLFDSCTSLTNLNLISLKSAGEYFMSYCNSLTNINLPSIESFFSYQLGVPGGYIFTNCNSLSAVTLSNLTEIGERSFEFCTSLVDLSIPMCDDLGGTVGNDNVFDGISGNTITLTVPTELMSADSGEPDGDIVYLQDNNTVTVIEVSDVTPTPTPTLSMTPEPTPTTTTTPTPSPTVTPTPTLTMTSTSTPTPTPTPTVTPSPQIPAKITPIAYYTNTGTTIPGTVQIGFLNAGIESNDYGVLGELYGIKYWGTPDQNLGVVIAKPDFLGAHSGNTSTGDIPAFVGFLRSMYLTEPSFVNLANYVANGEEVFTDGDEANIWLNDNGYWSSYSGYTESYLVGGNFSEYNLISSNNLIQLNTDGTVNDDFNVGDGFNNQVYTMSVQLDGKIIVGGIFSEYSGNTSNSIVRLNTNGVYDETFEIGDGFNSYVYASQVQSDNKILVGGDFTLFNNEVAPGIIRLNVNGTKDQTFDVGGGPDFGVQTISIFPDNKILIGGDFIDYGGTLANRIIKIDGQGNIINEFNTELGFNFGAETIAVQTDGKLLVGGDFTTYNNVESGKLIRLNTDGSIDSLFEVGVGFNSTVKSITLQSDEKIVVAGNFSSYSPISYNRIVSLQSDGFVNNQFVVGSGANNDVTIIQEQSDGKIVVGGYFTQIQDTSRNYIGRLNTDGSLDVLFNTELGFDNYVASLILQTDGKILVGGAFTSYSGISSNRIARLNTDGSYDSTFNIGSGFDSVIYSLSVQTDAKIIVGGDFTSYSGISSNRIARLNTDGSYDSTFNIGSGFDSVIYSLSVQTDGKILVGGAFTSYSGISSNRIARLNTDGSYDSTFNIGSGFNFSPLSFLQQPDGKIVIGGDFTTYQDITRSCIIRLNTDGSYDSTFDIGSGFDNSVNSVSYQSDGKIIAGGWFGSYQGVPANGLLRLNSNGSIDNSFNGQAFLNSAVSTTKVTSNGNIVIGGFFSVQVQSTLRYARLNPDGSYDQTYGAAAGVGFNSTVRASLTLPDNTTLMGGDFTTFRGESRNRIVKLTQGGVYDPSFSIGFGFPSGSVNVFEKQQDNKILIGGNFFNYYRRNAIRIDMLRSDSSHKSSFINNIGVNNTVETSQFQTDGKIIVGGQFTTHDFISRNRIIRLNTNGTYDESFNIGSGFNSIVYSVQVQPDGKIIIGGAFTQYQGVSRGRIIRLNTDASFDSTFNFGVGFNSDVRSITLQTDGKVIVGGSFSAFQGVGRNFIVRLNTDGSFDSSFNIGTGFNSTVLTSAIQSDGKVIVGGSFTSYNGTITNKIVRLNSDGTIDNTFNDNNLGYHNSYTSSVNVIKVRNNGKIIVGGAFTASLGITSRGLILLNTNGSYDSTFNVGFGFNSAVESSVVQSDGKVVSAGLFTVYNSNNTSRIARLNTNGTYDSSFVIGSGFNSTVEGLGIQSDQKIIVIGQFTTYSGQTRNRILRLNTNGSIDSTFNVSTGFNNIPYSVTILPDNNVIVGGLFTQYQGVSRNRIVRLNTDGSYDTSFVIGTAFNSSVFTTSVQVDGKLIVAGDFTSYSGLSYNRIIRLNTNGSLDNSFVIGTGFPGGSVRASAIQSDGKILVGGSFFSYSGINSSNIARLNSNGSYDSTFMVNQSFNSTVETISIQSDGKIIVGGVFTAYQGESFNRIVRLNTDGSYDSTFRIGYGLTSQVLGSTILADGRILLSGNFTGYQSIPSNNILQLNTNGTLDTLFDTGSGFNGTVTTIEEENNGKILVGGTYTQYQGSSFTQYRNRIARLNTDGSYDSSFNIGQGYNSTINNISINPLNGDIFVGGQFTNHSGYDVSNILRINSDGSYDTTFTAGFDLFVEEIKVQPNSKILVGGQFSRYNQTVIRHKIARLNSDGSLDYSFDPNGGQFFTNSGFDGTVESIGVKSDGKLLVGGLFTSYHDTKDRNFLIGLNSDSSYDPTFNVGIGFNNYVSRLLVHTDNEIFVVGEFTKYRYENNYKSLVKLLNNGGIDYQFNPNGGFNSEVNSSSIQTDGKILVGGRFTTYGEKQTMYFDSINTDGTPNTNFSINQGFNEFVEVSDFQTDGKVLVGGYFTEYQSIPAYKLVRINSNGEYDTTFTLSSTITNNKSEDEIIYSVKVQNDNKIVIGGVFLSLYNGNLTRNLIRLNSDGSLDPSFNVGGGVTFGVTSIISQTDGKLVIGGFFDRFNQINQNGISQLNSDGSHDPTFNTGIGFNRSVRTSALQSDGKVVVGGQFTTYQGINFNYVVRLNTDGSYDGGFNIGNGFNSSINTLVSQTDGKVIVGGNFSFYDGIPVNEIIRLNTDGSYDESFNVGNGFNSTVRKISILNDGNIIVLGRFTRYKGIDSRGIVKLMSNGNIDNAFNVGTGLNSDGLDFVQQTDGKIVVGGQFTQYQGFITNNIVRINTNGEYDSSFNIGSGFNSSVNVLSIQSDGKILIGGQFTQYQGVNRNRIVRLNTDGSYDSTFDIGSGFDSVVDTISIQTDGKIIVGGQFTQYQGVTRNYIARLNTDGSFDSTFEIGVGYDSIVLSSQIRQNGKVLIFGQFGSYQGTEVNRILRLHTDGNIDTSFNIGSGFDSSVFALSIQSDQKIVVGGSFSTYNGISSNLIVRLNTDGSHDPTFNIGGGFNNIVETISIQSDQKIVVGGFFTSYSGISSNRIARLNTDGSYDLTFTIGSGFNSSVNGLSILPDQKIVIGGPFTTYNSISCSKIVILNTDGSVYSEFNKNLGYDESVRDVIYNNVSGKIFVGGYMSRRNGVSSSRIARLNTDGSYDSTFNIGGGFNNIVETISIQSDGRINVGGVFTSYSGISSNRIARLNSDGSYDSTFNVGGGFNSVVYSLSQLSDQKILVGGSFTSYQGFPRNQISRLNTDGSLDNTFNISDGFNGLIYNILPIKSLVL